MSSRRIEKRSSSGCQAQSLQLRPQPGVTIEVTTQPINDVDGKGMLTNVRHVGPGIDVTIDRMVFVSESCGGSESASQGRGQVVARCPPPDQNDCDQQGGPRDYFKEIDDMFDKISQKMAR